MSGQLNRKASGVSTLLPEAATMRTILATIIAVITAAMLNSQLPVSTSDNRQVTTHKAVVQAAALLEKKVAIPKPAKPVTPPPKVVWQVSSSPHAKTSVADINTALSHYQDMGMTKQGAAYLIGNFVGESYLTPCGQYGDGGRAHGLGQWHPGRRADMPCDFKEQLTWAVNTEMVRDTPQLKEALFNPAVGIPDIKALIKAWERWGVEGSRWSYADHI